MKILLLTILVSMPVLAENIGIVSKDEQKMEVIDTYNVFDARKNELTVHLLSCQYSEQLKIGWQPEFGFLKCFPVADSEYFSAPGASLSIKINHEGTVGRTIFSTTQLGDKAKLDYHGYSKSWFRNAPIKSRHMKSGNNIRFSTVFEIPEKAVKVSLAIDAEIDEVID